MCLCVRTSVCVYACVKVSECVSVGVFACECVCVRLCVCRSCEFERNINDDKERERARKTARE